MNKKFKPYVLLLAADLLLIPGIVSAKIADLRVAKNSMRMVAKTAATSQSSDDMFGAMFKQIFGSESAQTKQRTCDDTTDDQDAGLVGFVNNLFCMLEHDLGIKTVGNVTKSDGTGAIHAEVRAGTSAQPVTDGTTTYDYEAKIWACVASDTVTCANASDFSRLIYLIWSYQSDGTVNKGKLIVDIGAVAGTAGAGAMFFAYDLGSDALNNSGNKTITFKSTGSDSKFRLDATKNLTSGTALTILTVVNTTTTIMNRIAASLSVDGLTGGSYAESSEFAVADSSVGVGVLNATASGDTPANKVCFARVPSGTDWNYSITSATSCTLMNFPAESCTDLSNWTTAAIDASINSQAWNGMTANPSSI